MSLKDKVIFVSGGSRGIGLAMAKRAAQDGAKLALAAKTADPHPKLPGTIYTAAEEIAKAGGEALPLICDISCLLYTSPSPRDATLSRMPSSA